MPFVKIHVSSAVQPDISVSLTRDVRVALVDVLEIEETIGQVMVYQIPVACRRAHSSRDINFGFMILLQKPHENC